MPPGRRLPWPLLICALILAATVSGGSVLLVVAPWLLYVARHHGQLRGCLLTGCLGYVALSLILAAALNG